MSQGFNQACFNFSDGFQRSRPHDQQIHVAQQSRRDKLRVQQGFETAVQDQERAEIAPLYEGMMLSEMFNFPAAADQIPVNWRFNSNPNSYWFSRHQQQQQQQQQQESMSSLGVAKSNTNNDSNNFTHHQISDINAADPTVAMQLFLMSPQTITDPSSSSPSTPLQFLGNPHQQIQALNFPAAGFPTGNNPVEFEWNSAKNKSWVPGESQQNNNNTTTTTTITNNNGNRDNQGLSLSLSSLQHLEAAIQRNGEVEKVEEMKMDNGVLLYSHGSSSSLKNFENSMQVPQHLIGRNFGNSMQNHQQFDLGLMGNLGNSIQTQQQQQQFHHQMGSLSLVSVLRNSKYLKGAHELLEEFCSVGRGQFKNRNRLGLKHDNPKWGNPNPNPSSSSSSSKDLPPLSPAERFEQQRRKAKLLAMLDEVDRRYNHYCEQMQMVVNSFDYIMGIGAATPYTSLAQKAMSRHFRCLRDAIGNQLKITSELLGEKDGGGVSGITKGETPRLRLLEQSLRQQRSFSQMGMMEQEAWRPQRGLPERSVNILRAWLFEHFLNPYPSDADKHLLARQTGLSRNQVSNWFINARVRLWKPMVEEMYQEESKAENQQQQHHHKAQTPDPSPSKRNQLNAHESDTSQTAINKHSNLAGHLPFSENQAFNNTNSPESLDFPTIDHRKNNNDADDDDRADILLPTTAAAGYNCVSLTLGLRHTGNQPENNQFSGNCGFKVPSMNQILRDFAG